ncbi:hypothetical protein GPECTOR_4g991 [Gonium pectorale]|uniref:Uncharacterized protein n=1 Tax=Gonium pectorale TaxID=33097 RepID=A0A150GYJ6_GONPE|nr:hypothetical protein GPECTOR_4g991 [Gonium pectorale]|eukprot:KXZ54919.1 hypothetical protein GPECTOR_4g991 [Gonium pectorale]
MREGASWDNVSDGEGDPEQERRLAAEQEAEGLDEELEDTGPKDWQRFYMGYHQRFVDACVLELRGGRTVVRLAQAPSAKCTARKGTGSSGAGGKGGKGGKGAGRLELDKASDPALTGTTVWDGAVVLSHYLTESGALSRPPERPYAYSGGSLPTVLELGAGTGAVSLALAATRCAASVTVTDLADLLPHLRVNASANAALLPPGRVHLAPLRWGQEGEEDVQRLSPVRPPFDVIVGSDLIYYTFTPATPHSALLLWTLRRLAGPHTTVFLSLSLHHNPEEVESFLQRAAPFFHVLRLRRSIPEEWRVPDVLVVRLTPRRQRGRSQEGEGEGAGGGQGQGQGKGEVEADGAGPVEEVDGVEAVAEAQV